MEHEIGPDSENFIHGSTRKPINEQSSETLGDQRVGIGLKVDVLVGVEVSSDPNLRDTTLDLVLIGLEFVFEGFEVLAVEHELLVPGRWYWYGLEKPDHFLKLRGEFFDGLRRHRS
jgi:hypothetical protein